MEDIVETAKNEGRLRAMMGVVVGDIEYVIKACNGRLSRPSESCIEKMIERYVVLKVYDKKFKYLGNYDFALEMIAMGGELSETDKYRLRMAKAELLEYSNRREFL